MNKKHQKINQQETKAAIKTIVPSDQKKNSVFPLIIVFCIPVLFYLHTLSFKFTNFDDDHLISDNIILLSDFHNAPRIFLKEAFIDKSGHFYRPMQTLSYMIDIKLSGGNKLWMYHLTNVLLLGFIVCLLYVLLRKFLIPKKLALLSVLAYAIHPLFVSSVAWIPARGDLMLMFFTLLSFVCLMESVQNKNYLFLHWITFSLALFCKETAAFLPFLFITYYLLFLLNKGFEKKYLLLIMGYFISGVFWFWIRSKAIGNYSDSNDLVGIDALIQNLQVIPESIALFFIPIGIVEFPVFSFFETCIGTTLILLGIFLLFKNKHKSKKEVMFAIAWFILLILPSMFFKNTQIDYLNHRFFLPLVGVLLFVLFSIPLSWFEKNEVKNQWILVVVLVVVSLMSYSKSKAYCNPIAFYTSATSRNSTSSIAHFNMGNMIKNSGGNYQQAINNYSKAIEIKPDYAEAYNNRGNIYLQQKLYEQAIIDYTKAIELKPDFADAYYDRGCAYNGQGLYDKSIPDFTKAIQYAPDYTRAYNNRGFAYFNQMSYDKAIIDYTKAIELKPDYARAYNNRGNAFSKQGLNDKAELDFKKAKNLGSQ